MYQMRADVPDAWSVACRLTEGSSGYGAGCSAANLAFGQRMPAALARRTGCCRRARPAMGLVRSRLVLNVLRYAWRRFPETQMYQMGADVPDARWRLSGKGCELQSFVAKVQAPCRERCVPRSQRPDVQFGSHPGIRPRSRIGGNAASIAGSFCGPPDSILVIALRADGKGAAG